MRALQALLPHPQIAQIDGRVVAGGAGADDHHAAGLADEDRRRDGGFAGMLEDDVRRPLLAQHLPDLRAEGAHALQPLGIAGVVLPVRQHSPVIEVIAVDAAFGAQLHAVVELVLARDHGDRCGADRLGDLDRHRTETARPAPDQHDIALLDRAGTPAMQHPPGGGRDQRIRRRLFPGHVLGLGHALLGLYPGELGKTAIIGFVTPDLEGRRVHRIAAFLDPLAIAAVLTAMHHHFVTDLDVGDILADLRRRCRTHRCRQYESLRVHRPCCGQR
jgi:hypothetical protein